MRFSVLVAGVFAALVSAQSTTPAGSATPSEVATQTYSIDPTQSSTLSCLNKCDPGDTTCQSHCITVPAPNEQQANDTITCVAACPQGDGSPEQTQKYSDCTQDCIAKHYYVSSEGTPQGTGAANNGNSNSGSNASKTGSAAVVTETNSKGEATGTKTEAVASATGTQSSATSKPSNGASGVAAGSAAFLGLVAAVLAL